MKFECHYCSEPATNKGPRNNGVDGVFLLERDDVVYIFCSAACRSRWFDVCGEPAVAFADARYADDVDPETLQGDTATE